MLASALRFGRIYPRHNAKMVVRSAKIKPEESREGPSADACAAKNNERPAGAAAGGIAAHPACHNNPAVAS